MTEFEFQRAIDDGRITVAQEKAMKDLQSRSGIEWEDFLSRCNAPTPLTPYVGVNDFHGMFVGIERDGYTHS